MILLNKQREVFAQAIVDGKNASDAYRKAYPSSVKWKPESVWTKSSQLLSEDKVSQRIVELKEQLAEKQLWTREKSVKALVSVINEPDKKGDVVAAVKELNNMHGFNEPTKHELTGKDGKPVAVETIFTINFLGVEDDDNES